MEIKGKSFELNNYIEVVFTNENGYQELHIGRIFDYDNDKIYLDKDLTWWSLQDTVEVKRDSIKRVRRIDSNLWRD